MAVNTNWPLVVDQIAFTGDPNDPNSTPSYTDLTARVRSFESSRGRQYEIDQNQTGEAHLTVSDSDEVLNPANTSAPAPYAGNIKPYRRYLRQAMWPPAPVGAATNLLWGQGVDPSFESYSAGASLSWILAVGSGVSPTVQAANPQQGTKSVQYAVTAGGGTNGVGLTVNCIPGQQYTSSLWIRQTAANTSQIFINGGAAGTSTSVTGSYVRLTVTYTATQPTHQLWVTSSSTSLSGTVNVDAIQHEPGTTATAFASSGPTIYTPFAGYVERWPSSWNHQGTYGLCALACVDAMAVLAGTDLHTEYRGAVMAKKPDYYWPLTEASGATTFAEVSGTSGSPALVNLSSPYGPGTLPAAGTSLSIPGDAGGTGVKFTNTNTSTTFGNTGTILANGVLNSGTGTFVWPPLSSNWAVSMALWVVAQPVTIPSPQAQVIAWPVINGYFPNPPAPTPIAFTVGSDNMVDLTFGGASGSNDVMSVGPNIADGKPHLLVGTVTQAAGGNTTATAYVDGVQVGSSTVTTASLGGAMTVPATGMMVGGFFAYTAFEQIVSGSVAHVAIWSRALSGTEISDLWNAGKGYPGETSGQRIARLLSIGGYTGPTAIDTGQSVMGVSTVTEGAALLDACQQVTLSENGNLYVEAGTAIAKSRTDRYLKITSKWTFGENQAGGEIPYEGDIAYDFDPARVVNDVTVTRVGGAKANAHDDASQKQYFRRSYQRTIGVASDNETIDAANYLLGQGKQPVQRVSRLSIKPSANPALWPVALGARIGDRVTVKRRTPTFTMSNDYFIEKVEHQNEPGSWVTTFQMSPVGRYQVGIFDDATYGIFDQTLIFGY